MESIAKVDVDVRKELYNGIILAGGSSMLTNVRERLEREVLEQAPGQARVKVIASQNVMERKFGVWIGGSILASLGSFQQCWMSKQDWATVSLHRGYPQSSTGFKLRSTDHGVVDARRKTSTD